MSGQDHLLFEVYGHLRFRAGTLEQARVRLDLIREDLSRLSDRVELKMEGADISLATEDEDDEDLPLLSGTGFEGAKIE